ncbi:MAG: cell division protein FtsA [Eubacteriaceae bacterium]
MDCSILEGKDIIFALDIGTRNVVGILGYENKQLLNIVNSCVIEHKTRAMSDGQIHDINKVTEVIKDLKEEMEKISGVQLHEVAIAAAGRVLKTRSSEAIIQFSEEKKILKTHILALEMQGVETAKQMLYDETKVALDYYCVAYSVMKYYLDGYEIDNLEGHKGCEIKAKIISTFLPRQVIDSLYTSVEGAQLTVSNLTLEPISAINLAIPKDLRMLNLALVDIGAGTSDIAITKQGSVTAYGMLPVAGDEFTEKLVEEYLIDFNTAEIIKKQLMKEEEIEFVDILGSKQCVSSGDILDKLQDTLHKMIDEIGNKILELNGNVAPKAVFCIGGGSRFPSLTECLAQKLNMSKDRVVVKSIKDISGLHFSCEEIKGPEFITPVGICLTTMMDKKNNFITIKLNGLEIKLLNTKVLNVMDAAIKGNFNSEKLMPRNGKKLDFIFNGEKRSINGELGTPAEILVNGRKASLKSEIHNNDIIVLTPSIKGKDASMYVSKLLEKQKEKRVYFGGKEISIKSLVKVNDEDVSNNYQIKNGDVIKSDPIDTISDVLSFLDIKEKEFVYFLNESITDSKATIKDNDKIDLMLKTDCNDSDKNKEEEKNANDFIVYVNEEPITLVGKDEYIFIHIFNYIDFDSNSGKGSVVLKLNGENAAYTDILNPQDKIEIYRE